MNDTGAKLPFREVANLIKKVRGSLRFLHTGVKLIARIISSTLDFLTVM